MNPNPKASIRLLPLIAGVAREGQALMKPRKVTNEELTASKFFLAESIFSPNRKSPGGAGF